MRIPIQSLRQHLERSLQSIYLVFGEEPLQQQEALDEIRTKARQNGFLDRQSFVLNPTDDGNEFRQSLLSLGLFSSHRAVDCKLLEGKLSDKAAQTLVEAINHLQSDTLLVFSANKLSPAQQKSAWFLAIEQKGVILQSNPLKGPDFNRWIAARLSQAGFSATGEALEYLVQHTSNNLLAAARTIDSLSLQKGPPKGQDKILLSIQAIKESLIAGARFSVFDLVDAALGGSPERTSQIFSSLRNEGIEATLALWALTREVRTIILIIRDLQAGRPLGSVLRDKGVWTTRQPLIDSFIKRTHLDFLYGFLQEAHRVDELIKTKPASIAWRSLYSLTLTLTSLRDCISERGLECLS